MTVKVVAVSDPGHGVAKSRSVDRWTADYTVPRDAVGREEDVDIGESPTDRGPRGSEKTSGVEKWMTLEKGRDTPPRVTKKDVTGSGSAIVGLAGTKESPTCGALAVCAGECTPRMTDIVTQHRVENVEIGRGTSRPKNKGGSEDVVMKTLEVPMAIRLAKCASDGIHVSLRSAVAETRAAQAQTQMEMVRAGRALKPNEGVGDVLMMEGRRGYRHRPRAQCVLFRMNPKPAEKSGEQAEHPRTCAVMTVKNSATDCRGRQKR